MSMNTKLRTETLFRDHRQVIYSHTDRLFAWLMIFQWIGGIVAAVIISPRTWIGEASFIHLHVWMAIVLGGLLNLFPAAVGFLRPGRISTRYIIAGSQVLVSALLIHLTGGRIETHFHIFGSLAFLAFYRDWKVLIPATLIVAFDHWFRGTYYPQSVYGVIAANPWRWLEHAGWVIFEDFFLILSIRASQREMLEIAERTALLEETNQVIEAKVMERTRELQQSNENLQKEVQERKKLEQMVVQTEKMAAVGQLAGGIAHEINNPLGVILGFAQSLVRRVPAGDPMSEPLKSIERESLRCKNLVRDLLTFSRASKVEKEEANLDEVLDSALSLVKAQTKVNNVDLIKEPSSSSPKIWLNSGQIQQVVINLCNNAMDAMPKGGKIFVRSKPISWNGKEAVEIQVQDTGKGIPAAIRPKIFEPFFTTKEFGKGTGLGLALAYEIIQKHQGAIEVESAEGRGTTFHIILPKLRKEAVAV